MNNKYQAKLTKEEIEAALRQVAWNIGNDGLTEEKYERFTYLAKRLLAIQAGKPEIETEKQEPNAPASTW